MSSSALIVACIAVLPALALAGWSWFAMVRGSEDLQALDAYQRMHFND